METVARYEAPATPKEAAALQRDLRRLVLRKGRVRTRLVAGVDVGYKGNVARAAIVVLRRLETVEEVVIEEPLSFPYVPGLFSFREIPPLLTAWKRLRTRPDVVLVDGQGIAHPRRFGLASHFGVLIGIPTIGCAKSRLIGEHDVPDRPRGSWSPLRHKEETIGAVLRTQDGGNPLFVSIGHLISLKRAISVVLACTTRYRLPEPQRRADRRTKSP